MVGSKAWFQYEDDTGLKYAVELDETAGDTEALGFGPVDISDTVAQGRMLTSTGSRPLAMRYLNCSRLSSGATIRQKFFVGNPVDFADLRSVPSVTIGGVVWSVSSLRGEKVTLIPLTDSGQTDGDVGPTPVP